MDISKAEKFTMYIIESLHEGDMRTGENLHDAFRQMCVDYPDFCFTSQYISIFDKDSFLTIKQDIADDVDRNNKMTIRNRRHVLIRSE